MWKNAVQKLCLLAVLGLLVFGVAVQGVATMNNSVLVTYENGRLSESVTQMTVLEDGTVRILCLGNEYAKFPVRSLGMFAGQMEARSLQTLKNIIADKQFLEAPAQESMMSGDAFIQLHVPQAGISKLYSGQKEQPAAVQPALQILDAQLKQTLGGNPQSGVAVMLSEVKKNGDTHHIVMRYQNAGKDEVHISAPATGAFSGDFAVSTPGLEPESTRYFNKKFLGEVVPQDKAGVITLKPGESMAVQYVVPAHVVLKKGDAVCYDTRFNVQLSELGIQSCMFRLVFPLEIE